MVDSEVHPTPRRIRGRPRFSCWPSWPWLIVASGSRRSRPASFRSRRLSGSRPDHRAFLAGNRDAVLGLISYCRSRCVLALGTHRHTLACPPSGYACSRRPSPGPPPAEHVEPHAQALLPVTPQASTPAVASCPFCGFEARAVSQPAADAGLGVHGFAVHRVRLALVLVGVLGADGRLVTDAGGLVRLPEPWRLRRDWQ